MGEKPLPPTGLRTLFVSKTQLVYEWLKPLGTGYLCRTDLYKVGVVRPVKSLNFGVGYGRFYTWDVPSLDPGTLYNMTVSCTHTNSSSNRSDTTFLEMATTDPSKYGVELNLLSRTTPMGKPAGVQV